MITMAAAMIFFFLSRFIAQSFIKSNLLIINPPLVVVKELKDQYPDADVIGHNEISEKKCPSFDVQEWKKDNL